MKLRSWPSVKACICNLPCKAQGLEPVRPLTQTTGRSRHPLRPAMHFGSDFMDEALRADGWEHLPSEGLIAHLGGLWQRITEGEIEFGFVAGPHHLNLHGVVHGGMMMTVVDRAFALAAHHYSQADPMATISLSHQFLAPMSCGAFARVGPRLLKSTPRMAFIEGILTSGGEPLLQAQGVWRMKSH